MFSLEMIRWWRSRRLLVLVLVLVFSGVSSPLMQVHLPDILSKLGDSSVIVANMASPTREELLSSYFKNSSQLGLLVSCYLCTWGMSMGDDAGMRLYYRSRSRRAFGLLLPRIAATTTVAVLAVALGAVAALYESSVLTDQPWRAGAGDIAAALFLHAGALVCFSLLAGVVAAWTGSAFGATIGVCGVVLLAGLTSSSDAYKWTPMSLLSPGSVFDGEGTAQPFTCAAITACVLTVLLALTSARSLRVIKMHSGTVPLHAAQHVLTEGRSR